MQTQYGTRTSTWYALSCRYPSNFLLPQLIDRNSILPESTVRYTKIRKGNGAYDDNKNVLMALRFGVSQSSDIIRKAKRLMVNKGFAYYDSKRLGRVLVEAVEEILELKITLPKEVV